MATKASEGSRADDAVEVRTGEDVSGPRGIPPDASELDHSVAEPERRTPSIIDAVLMTEARTALDDELQEYALRIAKVVIRAHASRERAAMALGVSSRTLRRWEERYPNLRR